MTLKKINLYFVVFFIIRPLCICFSNDVDKNINEKTNIEEEKNKDEKNISENINDEYNSVYDDKNSKFVINKIFVKGCSEKHIPFVKSVLTIKEGDLVNLKSSTISTNIKRILLLCNFADDVRCTYTKCENNDIDIFFYVKEAPLIVDFDLHNFKNDKVKESIEKSLGKRYSTSAYISKLKKVIINQFQEDGEENYKIVIEESKDENLDVNLEKRDIKEEDIFEEGNDKNIIKIKFTKINNEESIFKNLLKINSLNNDILQNIFKENYDNVKKLIKNFQEVRVNNSPVSGEDLTDEVIVNNLDKTLLQTIIEIFKNKPLVKIEIEERKSKGVKKYIKDLFFEGNNNLDSDFLKNEMLFFSHEMSTELKNSLKSFDLEKIKNVVDIFKFYTLVKSSTLLNKEKINSLKQKIIECYNKHGFINAKIEKVELNKIEDTNYYYIKFFIEEGEKFFINKISFSGNKTFPDSILRSILGLKQGDVFDYLKINEKINGTQKNMMMDGLKSFYNNEGFLECSIQIKKSFVGNKVNLYIEINEGEKSKVGIVKITGNEYTEGNYFKHFLNLYPGEEFRISNFAISQQSLARSEIVDKENLSVFPIKNNVLENTLDVHCNLKEKLRVTLNGGVNSVYVKNGGWCCHCAPRIFGTFSIGNLNLKKLFHLHDSAIRWFGKQQDLNIEISANPTEEMSKISTYKYSISSGLFIPNIIGNIGTACGFSLSQYHKTWDDGNDENNTDKEKDENKEKIRSFHFYSKFVWNSFNRKLLIKVGVIDLNFTWNIFSCCKNEEDVLKRALDIPLSFDIRYSTIDKSFFVTKGYDLFLSISATNPLLIPMKDKKENKYIFEVMKYIQPIVYLSFYKSIFSKNVVFNVALYGGLGLSFPSTARKTHYFQLNVGPIETYFLEGSDKATSFFLKGIDEDNFSLKCLNKSKCRLAFKTNIELRFKILESNYFGIYLFGFFNGGNLFSPSSNDDVWYKASIQQLSLLSRINPVRFCAAGAGVRLNIPIIGVLGIHFGVDINTKEFGFGLTFRQDYELIF